MKRIHVELNRASFSLGILVGMSIGFSLSLAVITLVAVLLGH